jgi:hypothetical protein
VDGFFSTQLQVNSTAAQNGTHQLTSLRLMDFKGFSPNSSEKQVISMTLEIVFGPNIC